MRRAIIAIGNPSVHIIASLLLATMLDVAQTHMASGVEPCPQCTTMPSLPRALNHSK